MYLSIYMHEFLKMFWLNLPTCIQKSKKILSIQLHVFFFYEVNTLYYQDPDEEIVFIFLHM